MLKQKNFIVIGTVIGAVVLLGAGCAKQSAGDKNQLGGRVNNVTSTERGFKIEGTKTTSADLTVGKKIMVMGTTNADGTISATQILLGDFASRPGFSSSTARRVPNQGQQRSAGNTNWQGQRGGGGARPANRPQMQGNGGTGRLVGEILKTDDASLIFKVQDGGSKIVFYSDKTEILIVASSTGDPARSPPKVLLPGVPTSTEENK